MAEAPELLTEERSADLLESREAGPVALRGGVLRAAAYAATVALSLVSVPLLIRHLGISRFGEYSTVLALATIVGGITDAGLANIAVREWVTRTGEERRQITRSLLGIRLELSLCGLCLGVIFALVAGYREAMVLGTLVAGVGVLLQAVVHILCVPLQAGLRFGWTSFIDLCRQIVAVALIVLLVLVGAGLLPLLAVNIPAGLVMVALAGALVRREMPLVPRLRGTHWWPLVRDTLPYSAAMSVSTIYLRLTIVVMSLITTARATGYFATSFRVVEVLNGFPVFAVAAAFPILSRASAVDRKRFAYASERMIELALIGGGALTLAVVLSAPFVIAVLAGSHGAPASSVLQIQGLGLIGTFVVVATSYVLLALRRHSVLLTVNLAALMGNVVLTIVLVPVWGARGGALACLITESLLATGQLVLIVRTGTARARPSSLAVVAAAGLASASLLLIPGLHPVPRTFAGLAIYVAVLAVLGHFPPEVSHALRFRRPEHAQAS